LGSEATEITSADGSSISVEPFPWPHNIVLYLPTNQQLTPDYLARSLSVLAILKLCNLEFSIEQRRNAEFLGPDKQWPVLRCGDKLACGFESIRDYIRLMGYLPSQKMSDLEQAEILTYLVYVDSTFQTVEKYLCWCVENEYNTKTKPRHFSFYWKPISFVLPVMKRWDISGNLKVLGYPNNEAGLERVFQELTTLCKAVSSKLEKNKTEGLNFLFGNQMTEVDVVFASHVQAMEKLFVSFGKLEKLFVHELPHLVEYSNDCMHSITDPRSLLNI